MFFFPQICPERLRLKKHFLKKMFLKLWKLSFDINKKGQAGLFCHCSTSLDKGNFVSLPGMIYWRCELENFLICNIYPGLTFWWIFKGLSTFPRDKCLNNSCSPHMIFHYFDLESVYQYRSLPFKIIKKSIPVS